MEEMSAPEPSPSRTNSRICCMVAAQAFRLVVLRGGLEPAGHLDEHVLALVDEELRAVIADPGSRRVLTARQLRGAERDRPGERLRPGEHRRRGDLPVPE